jgi:hypothetical protein
VQAVAARQTWNGTGKEHESGAQIVMPGRMSAKIGHNLPRNLWGITLLPENGLMMFRGRKCGAQYAGAGKTPDTINGGSVLHDLLPLPRHEACNLTHKLLWIAASEGRK